MADELKTDAIENCFDCIDAESFRLPINWKKKEIKLVLKAKQQLSAITTTIAALREKMEEDRIRYEMIEEQNKDLDNYCKKLEKRVKELEGLLQDIAANAEAQFNEDHQL